MKTGFFSLSYFIEMLNLVTYVFEWRKLLNSHLNESAELMCCLIDHMNHLIHVH